MHVLKELFCEVPGYLRLAGIPVIVILCAEVLYRLGM